MNNSFQKLLTICEKFRLRFAPVFQRVVRGRGKIGVAFLRVQARERIVTGNAVALHQAGDAGLLRRDDGDSGIAYRVQAALKKADGIDDGKRLVAPVQPPPYLGNDARMGDGVEPRQLVRGGKDQLPQLAALQCTVAEGGGKFRFESSQKLTVTRQHFVIQRVAVDCVCAQLLRGQQQRRLAAAGAAGDAKNFHTPASGSMTRKAAAFFRRLPTA